MIEEKKIDLNFIKSYFENYIPRKLQRSVSNDFDDNFSCSSISLDIDLSLENVILKKTNVKEVQNQINGSSKILIDSSYCMLFRAF